MSSRFGRLVIVFAAVFAGTGPLSATDIDARISTGDDSLLARCWTGSALAGNEKERQSLRYRAPVDLSPLKQAPPTDTMPVSDDLRGSIRSVELPDGEKLIALTFDLCESGSRRSGYDGHIIDYLRNEGVKATLFISGKWLVSHPDRAQQLIADELFEIGGHGFQHRDFSRANATTLSEEIQLTDAAYHRARNALISRSCVANSRLPTAVQERLTLMRFPYGRCNAPALTAVAMAGQLAIQWDVVTGDPDPRRSAKKIASTILAQAHPGAIVVAHANGRGHNTAEALKLVVPKLRDDGYRFVTVSVLLAAGTPVIFESCYLERPGDLSHVAHGKQRWRSRRR